MLSEAQPSEDQPSEDHAVDDPATIDWQSEVLTPKQRIQLSASSKTQNLDDPYWKLALISRALNSATVRPKSVDGENSNEDEANAASQPDSIFNDLAYFTSESMLWMQELNATASTEGSTPLPSMLLTPTEETVQKFNEQQKYLDNILYQREDHLAACKELGIPNPDLPRMPGMRPSISLKFWQPVAIKALREFAKNKALRGAILGDHVGLGKTWITICYLMNVCNFGKPSPDPFLT